MSNDSNNWELAEAYLAGTLPDKELTALRNRLDTDPVFAADFQETINLLNSLEGQGKQKAFRSMLQGLDSAGETAAPAEKMSRTIKLTPSQIKTAAIAAGVALLICISMIPFIQHSNKNHSKDYQLLVHELNNIKRSQEYINRSQKQIIQKINGLNEPAIQARYSGTGFALTNDGYFVTNYHVARDADSIYIQNRNGEYYKANIVTFDEGSDVAILRVENKNFHFSKGEVPYTFAPTKKGLGARVYTIGYPQDEVVYNEGYISSRNGFLGDSIQYRLELPASPGQSGAPVVDASGNIIAIVTGKESESEGTTYAVSSKAIYQLLNSLPPGEQIRLPKSNKLGKLNREQQIDKLQNYTCLVKIYK